MGNNRDQNRNVPQRPQNLPANQSSQPQPISPELLQTLLANQQQEAQNEANRIRLREKELDLNARFAEQSLKANTEYISKTKPNQDRKTFGVIAGAAAFFMISVMVFVVYLLNAGERDIVISVLKGIGWLASVVASYFVGQHKSNKEKTESGNSPSAEEVS